MSFSRSSKRPKKSRQLPLNITNMASINLSNLRPAKGATKKRKRIGRGGKRGTYSGRGIKGQKARSGVSGLKALGMRKRLLQTPKKRGFTSLKPKFAPVNLGQLDQHFADGQTVDKRQMILAGLADKGQRIKVLANGQLAKKLTVIADDFSIKAKEAIIAAGGQVQINA